MRHITGNLYDHDKARISLQEELLMFKEVYIELKQDYPNFEFKMMVCGHKWFGKWHIDKMLDHIQQTINSGDEWIKKFIVGLDLINEEDITPAVSSFAESIIPAKYNLLVNDKIGEGLPCFFHCGETSKKESYNIQDSIALGTKRIGHGL